MAKTRIPAVALVVLLVLALATPAGADSLESELQRRDAASAKRAQLAAQLDTLKANDGQLEAAVRDLDAHVDVQTSNTESAQQAATVARSAVGSAEARLATTEARMAQLRAKTSAMAIRAYVHPAGNTLLEVVSSQNMSEASRRETLLSQLASNDRDVLEQLRATRQDQQAEQSDLARLREQADTRRRAAAARLAELQRERTDQVRLRGALDARIEEFTTEVDALSREQSNIEALIRARQAAPRLALPAGGGAIGRTSRFGLIWPANGPITSGFGMRWGRMHTGIDIGAGMGTPIRAAKAGTVISAGTEGGYGQVVIIDHGGGLSTLYAHQSQIAATDGQTVAQGQVIGYVGCSGHCTGPHLHFETRIGGSPENPMNFLP